MHSLSLADSKPFWRVIISLLLFDLRHVSALWPAPQSYTLGSSVLYINQYVELTYNGKALPYTPGYVPFGFKSQQLVQAGVSRALTAIFQTGFVPWKLHARDSKFEPDLLAPKTYVKTIQITQSGKDGCNSTKPLSAHVDESYNLTVTADGAVKLAAVSSTGVLRGLETFVQLFYKHSAGPLWYTPLAPVSIQDSPSYSHRGVLLDVARNWYSLADITRTIDAMSWSKLNRLHVHVTDSQSWPLQIPAIPELAEKGAYRPDLTYSPSDIKFLQVYGLQRGVEVYFEIDMPGHIGSVAWSHPELIVAFDAAPYDWWCSEPPCGAFKLNDTGVDAFLEKLFDDLLPRVAPYTSYFHTGGDELNANDSTLDPGIRTNASEVLQPLLQAFIDAQHKRVRKAGLTPLVWEEIPLDWNVTLGKDTVVQTWLSDDSVATVTSKGLQVIDSNYNYWYLDCGRGQWIDLQNGGSFDDYYPFNDWCGPTKSWALVYQHDPRAGLSEEAAKLVLGGEVAVWSETIDPVNLDSLVWPRASAAGEVLWSGRQDSSGQNRSQVEAAPRLNEFRERLVARGIGASPIQMIWCTQGNATECAS